MPAAGPLVDSPLVDVHVDQGRFLALPPSGTVAVEARTVVDAAGALVSPPYVEPHVHLDGSLTAGEPRWNVSGTLWEGIACWAERKPLLTREDVIGRVEEVLRWYAANGALHVRSHVDVTDPSLTALDALLEVRDRVRDVIGLQLVAFPQEGICSYPGGEALLEEAARRGVDVIGAIPHYEDTREDGVRSVEIAVEIAQRHGLRVDAHCDEIDDDQSRFIEVLATQAHRTGLRERVTASHTTAMGSYNAAYSSKLQRIVSRSGISLVCNPMVNLHLQGRFDGYPKRRGLTQVKEMLAAGVNVAFGHDDIMDPWYPMGTANPLQVAFVGAHATQLHLPGRGGGVLPHGHRPGRHRARAGRGVRRRRGPAGQLPPAPGQQPLRRGAPPGAALPRLRARAPRRQHSPVRDDADLARRGHPAGRLRPRVGDRARGRYATRLR